MVIRVLFFGVLKDLVGRAEESLQVRDGSTVADVLAEYRKRHPAMEKWVPSLAVSVNQQYSPIATALNAGDEIAIREGAKKLIIVEQGVQYAAQNPVPAWLEANFENMSGRVLNLPKRQDVNLPINEQLIVELYSK